MLERLGFIICVEKYLDTRFRTVDFARKDGVAVRNLFLQVFKIPQEQLFTFFDSDATLENVSDCLSYWLRPGEPFEFYLYYAGHGAFSHGQNWLTAYNSNSEHIQGTGISLKRDIVDRLGAASRAVLFLDTCSSFLSELQVGKTLADMHFTLRDGPTCDLSAVYFSSSPGERAVSCSRLEHGVWTSSLIKGLGDYSPAADGAGKVTDVSLRDYLSSAVSEHFSDCDAHVTGRTQTPQALLSASATFTLTHPKSRPASPAEVVAREDALIAAYKGYQTSAESVARASGVPFKPDDLFDPVLGNIFGEHYFSKALFRVNEARRAIEQIGKARGTWSETPPPCTFVDGEDVRSDALPSITNFLNFAVVRFRAHPYSRNLVEGLRGRYLSWINPDLESVRIVHISGLTYLETQFRENDRDALVNRLALDFISDPIFNPDTPADEVGRYLFEKFDVYSLLMTGIAEQIFTNVACDEAAAITQANEGLPVRMVDSYCHPDSERLW